MLLVHVQTTVYIPTYSGVGVLNTLIGSYYHHLSMDYMHVICVYGDKGSMCECVYCGGEWEEG